MNKGILAIGAIIIGAILIFVAFGGIANPYFEEDFTDEDMDGTWAILVQVEDKDGNLHDVPTGTTLALYTEEGVQFQYLHYTVLIKANNKPEAPDLFDEVLINPVYLTAESQLYKYLSGIPTKWGLQVSDSWPGSSQTISVDDDTFHEIGTMVYDMELIVENYDNGRYHHRIWTEGYIEYIPSPYGGSTKTVNAPDLAVAFIFDKLGGELDFTWTPLIDDT